MITKEFKQKVVQALIVARRNFEGSDAKFALSIGLNAAQWSRIKKYELEKVVSDQKWISLARLYNVQIKDSARWNTAKTPVFEYITQQFEHCQENSVSCIICDIADIGKTYTAQVYAKTHKNAIYVDCSQVKTKQKLVRDIAKQFGVGYSGRYYDVYSDLVFYLRTLSNPIIILDEAGDLRYDAFLELKALWNATERCVGWAMIGADGLEEKINRSIDFKKVGYTEIFSRYGGRYQHIAPKAKKEQIQFNKYQASLIIKANSSDADIQKVIAKTDGSLRRIYTELTKISA